MQCRVEKIDKGIEAKEEGIEQRLRFSICYDTGTDGIAKIGG
jgi:hypothetical protein